MLWEKWIDRNITTVLYLFQQKILLWATDYIAIHITVYYNSMCYEKTNNNINNKKQQQKKQTYR